MPNATPMLQATNSNYGRASRYVCDVDCHIVVRFVQHYWIHLGISRICNLYQVIAMYDFS